MIKYSGAGDLPLIVKKDNITTLKSEGLLLGFSKDSEYTDCEVQMNSGDEVILLTDGIIESRGPDGNMFGHEGLTSVLSSIPSEINSIETIKTDFTKYVNNKYEDDVSLIVLKKL